MAQAGAAPQAVKARARARDSEVQGAALLRLR